MIINEREVKTEEEHFFVIAMTGQFKIERQGKMPKYEDRTCYFKSERYSTWRGNFQVEYGIDNAKKWKTADGVKKALATLKAKPNLIRHLETAKACLYIKVVVETKTLTPVE